MSSDDRRTAFPYEESAEEFERYEFEAPDPYRTVAPIDAALAVPASRRIGGLAQEFQQIFSTYNLRDQRKDANRAYAQLFLYAPLNRTGYDTITDFAVTSDTEFTVTWSAFFAGWKSLFNRVYPAHVFAEDPLVAAAEMNDALREWTTADGNVSSRR